MATPHYATRVDWPKHPTGPKGTRRAAGLTPEKLAKKRASDRESQRMLRESRRSTIERLTGRIDELESLDVHRMVHQALAEKDFALRAVERLRHKLVAIAGIVNAETSHLADIGDKYPGETVLAHDEEHGALSAQQRKLCPEAVPSEISHDSFQQFLHHQGGRDAGQQNQQNRPFFMMSSQSKCLLQSTSDDQTPHEVELCTNRLETQAQTSHSCPWQRPVSLDPRRAPPAMSAPPLGSGRLERRDLPNERLRLEFLLEERQSLA